MHSHPQQSPCPHISQRYCLARPPWPGCFWTELNCLPYFKWIHPNATATSSYIIDLAGTKNKWSMYAFTGSSLKFLVRGQDTFREWDIEPRCGSEWTVTGVYFALTALSSKRGSPLASRKSAPNEGTTHQPGNPVTTVNTQTGLLALGQSEASPNLEFYNRWYFKWAWLPSSIQTFTWLLAALEEWLKGTAISWEIRILDTALQITLHQALSQNIENKKKIEH